MKTSCFRSVHRTSNARHVAFALILSWLSMAILAVAETVSYERPEPGRFMKRWLVLGPIPISEKASSLDEEMQKKAFAADLLAAHGGESAVQPESGVAWKIGEKEFAWKLVESSQDIVDLAKELGRKENAAGYAWAEISSPNEAAAILGIGSDDAVKVWLNGKVVHEHWAARPVGKDDDIVPVTLRAGKNRLLLKVQNSLADWGFSCRILDRDSVAQKLVAAAGQGSLETVQSILVQGVEINAKNRHGLTALDSAKMGGHQEVVEFLLSRGADAKSEPPAPERIIDSVLQSLTSGDSSGLAVLVARDGKVLFKKGYGYANLEHKVRITPETKFRIGSVSKQFTAVAILQLQERGKLSVTDALAKYLPEYPRGSEVTLHHLLTHTSGIRSYTDKPDFMATVTASISPEDLIKSFRDDPYDFSPGERWHYNNSGYFLLGYLVGKISGDPYAAYLKRHFFEPLGMKNTGVHHYADILEKEATGYSYENGEFKKALNWDMSRAGGAGALYSTVEDLYRWNEALFSGGVLSPATLKAAFTPVQMKGAEAAGSTGTDGYGYGWMISQFRGVRVIGHGGGLQGFLSYLARYDEKNLTIVLLSNAAAPPPGINPAGLTEKIAEAYLWKELKPRERLVVNAGVNPKSLDALVGRYDYGMAVLIVTKEGNRLFAQLTGQPRFEIYPKSETEFFWKVAEAQVTFVQGDNGEVERAVHRQGGQTIVAPKLKETPVAAIDAKLLDAYVGKYDYGQGKAIMTVTRDGDRLFTQITGQPKFEIFPKSNSEFFWKVVNAEVSFLKDPSGKVIKGIHRQAGRTLEAPKIE